MDHQFLPKNVGFPFLDFSQTVILGLLYQGMSGPSVTMLNIIENSVVKLHKYFLKLN